MDWLGMYGFENTFGLAVRKDIAQKYNLQTYSDLAASQTNLPLAVNMTSLNAKMDIPPFAQHME